MFSIVMLVPHTNLQGLKLVLCVNRRLISLMSRNEVPASVPTAPYTVTEGVFRVAASTEYYSW